MTDSAPRPTPTYVVLRPLGNDRWERVAEVPRRPGLTAKAARARAIEEATSGKAKPGEAYAAVLRGEWRIAFDW